MAVNGKLICCGAQNLTVNNSARLIKEKKIVCVTQFHLNVIFFMMNLLSFWSTSFNCFCNVNNSNTLPSNSVYVFQSKSSQVVGNIGIQFETNMWFLVNMQKIYGICSKRSIIKFQNLSINFVSNLNLNYFYNVSAFFCFWVKGNLSVRMS